jgi:cytochrome b6
VATPLGIKPEWYFTFMFTTLKLIPSHIFSFEGEKLAILGFMVGGALWLLVPFLNRRASRELPSRPVTVIGAVLLLYIVVMTVLTYTIRGL